MGTQDSITIRQPDDWHLHVRDGEVLKAVLSHTSNVWARAIIMPNLVPPVTTVEMALAYRDRIMAAAGNPHFTPLMTLYLTDNTDPKQIKEGKESGVITAVKLYPQGATTNSDFGVTSIEKVYPVIRAMEDVGMPLLIHGEVTDVDIFDREAVFIERTLRPLLEQFRFLKVVLEHITTREGVRFVQEMHRKDRSVAATITPHHLVIDRNDIFEGGIQPHRYCLPIAKRKWHKEALVQAAISGMPCFFAGTDSAPHLRSKKEASCGCAGIFCAPTALQTYAEIFDSAGVLHQLEGFVSEHGARFYGLPLNERTVTLSRQKREVPVSLPCKGEDIQVFRGGEIIPWKVTDVPVAAV